MEILPQRWMMREPFVIARGAQTEQDAIAVILTSETGARGRGEACGVDYAGETVASMTAQLESVRAPVLAGAGQSDLPALLPPGGARFALDAALWDLEAKAAPGGIAALTGIAMAPVTTAYTIGIRSLADYEATARRFADFRLLKVKVNADDPIAAIAAVKRGAPDAALIVDPNQAWTAEMLAAHAPILKSMGVVLIEQPVAVGAEASLDGWRSPIPLAADELVDGEGDLDRAAGRFDVINIKLDKCGGLTAALALAEVCHARGFGLMVGCMAGSSLCMAPALVLAQRCDFVDLDGPLLLAGDWPDPLTYHHGVVAPPTPALWG
ncbi:dipeptide epimerase [Novosphingobium sp. Chol11]|uniref:dipeptide epimerase n=1 Tax=Novosphingobium sp. Chol11 TaxID=1385763 RepID=UPI0025D91A68|nr:dipeptide epimerase [Novosphingobium sp. Chol11]